MRVEEFRKDLHQIPELGRCEYETKKYIVSVLRNLSCKLYYPTETAVVAYFDLKKSKTLCFRADMDGLSIKEETNLSFASKHIGKMHACGHDGHMSMVLALGLWIEEHLELLNCNVVLLFQPSEEDNAGANDILESGILKELSVDEIYGMHLWPMLEQNQIYTKEGSILASSTEIDITFNGKSVHAANRDKGIDSILIASKFLDEFYQFSNSIEAKHLLSFGSFEGNGARNVVCDHVVLKGTLRTFDEKTLTLVKEYLNEQQIKWKKEVNMEMIIHLNEAYPFVKNDEQLVNKYQSILDFQKLKEPLLQAEDFGCYTHHYPCLFLLLGIGNEHLLHTTTFDFPMEVLSTGVEAYCKILLNA
ncbi:MAG: amidohydrolase [Anaeroplasmataceae bacterium]|nr:amidohydrolase [Anaeroplasmataceae bacterium]